MEYAEGGELFDYIIKKDHLSEGETRLIFHQIIDAIDYMHQIGICHRDLKPENILFDSSFKKIKIIDFGLSNLYFSNNIENDENSNEELEFDYLETPCGSPGYAPPEMVLGYSYNGLKTDIWSSGIILYAMLCGSFPFDDDSEQVLYSKIIKGIFDFPDDIILSDEAKNLVKKILVVNPSYRATMDDIKNDPWFKVNYTPTYGLFFFPLEEIPVDKMIIKEMEKNGYNSEEIIKNVKNNKHNEITTFYYLLVKKYNRNGIETVNDLISPSFTKYVLKQYQKIVDIDNYQILLNLKYNFEQLKKKEKEKEMQKRINKEKEYFTQREKEKECLTQREKEKESNLKKEKKKESKEIKENKEGKKENDKNNNNKNELKHNKTLETTNNKEEMNIRKNTSNLSQKKEDNSKNNNYSHIYKIKENQKNYRNKNLGALHKNKRFKKFNNIIDKKDLHQYNKKLKLNSYTLEKPSFSNNKKELKTSMNAKREGNNESFPFPDNEISTTLAISTKRDQNYISQGIHSSRINTDRINYEKYFLNKPNIKAALKKGNIPLYQKFTLNCNENKNINLRARYKTNQGLINKFVKSAKTSAFNVYYFNNKLKLKNIQNANNSIKNITSKNYTFKNMSIHKEKGNMSYRQIQRDKILFENNLSRILTVSEGKSHSNSKANGKLHISTPFNTSSRNKYYKNAKKIRNSEQIVDNNYYKKISKYHIDNKDKKDKKKQELKINSNKSNDNNINLSININLNLNQNKYLKEKQNTGELNKQNLVRSLKGIKLDLKKINNNFQIYNRNSLTNSERNNENIFKIKQELMMNKRYNCVNTAKSLIHNQNQKKIKTNSNSKEEYKFKKFDELIIKNQENKQKSFLIQNPKKNMFTNSLSKLLPFLKDLNFLKAKSLKKPNPQINVNQNSNLAKKIMNINNNNSNSIILNKINQNANANNNMNINTNMNTNNNLNTNNNILINPIKNRVNPKIEQIKQTQNFINFKNHKNFTNNSYLTDLPNNNNILSDRNHSKKSPNNLKMKPLNLKRVLNDRKNSYVYKSLTMRGDQAKNKILISIKDELLKSGKNKNKVKKNDKLDNKQIINTVSLSQKMNKDAIFGISPFKLRDLLLTQLPKNDINIKQKSTSNNYFVFLCLKGTVKMIVELLQIKGSNFILVHMKYYSGNQDEFAMIKKQILSILNRFKNMINA